MRRSGGGEVKDGENVQEERRIESQITGMNGGFVGISSGLILFKVLKSQAGEGSPIRSCSSGPSVPAV